MKYDIVIIGSGLGGLECGAFLSKEGYNVCVIEKDCLLGGCLQTFSRNGYRLDTGFHYVGSMEKGQVIGQCFRYLGIADSLKLRKLDENGFDRIWFGGKTYAYASGFSRFEQVLTEQFPHEKDGIRKYTDKIREISRIVSVDNFRNGYVSSKDGVRYMYVPTADVIDSMVSDNVLRNVLAGTCFLHEADRRRSSFYEHGMVMTSYLEGAYRCVDGSMQIADLLVERILGNGGTVMNNCRADRIAVEDGHVTGVGVTLADGTSGFLEAGYVISDIHPLDTLSILDPTPRIRPAYRDRIRSLDNTFGVFTLYLMMEKGSCPYQNYNTYLHAGEDVWFSREMDRSRFRSCLISMQPISSDPGHAEVVSVMAPMFMDELREWEDTLPEHRGEGYLDFKRRRSEELLDLMERCGVRLSGKTVSTLATTPLSYRDYTGTPEGSAYGLVKDCRDPLRSMINPRSKVGNLLFTGQNVNMHGVMGVTLTSVMTCSELLGQEYLTKRIAYA